MSELSSPIRVPEDGDLRALQQIGAQIGYRGAHIYVRYRGVLEVLRGQRFRRALGIGSGFGIFDRLLPEDLRYTGLDVEPKAIAFASAWARDERPLFDYRAQTLHDCRFEAGAFDLVLLSEVVEHVPEAEVPALMAEIDRVLAPGGALLLSVPNHWHPRNRARALLRRPTVLMDKTHLREYSLDEAHRFVAGLPFAREAFLPVGLYFPFERHVSRVLDAGSPLRDAVIRRLPALSSHFVYLLRKLR